MKIKIKINAKYIKGSKIKKRNETWKNLRLVLLNIYDMIVDIELIEIFTKQ